MNTIRYGIIGGGFNAAFHLRGIDQVRGIEVGGFLTRSARAAEMIQYCQNHDLGEPWVYKDVQDMVRDADVICFFGKHTERVGVMEQIVDAVKAGESLKGLVCEKPFARNMPEARRMLELVREIDVPNAYFENQLHMNVVNNCREQLAPVMQAMGPLLLARASEEHSGAHSGWFWDPTIAGGGVLHDMGCHCLAVVWYALTPLGKDPKFLKPVSVSADIAMLKWGQPRWAELLKRRYDVDFLKNPAEDFATGIVTFENPETGQKVKGQFTSSWMYDNQGLRLYLDGLGAGYAMEMNTLEAPSRVFISDDAAGSLTDLEAALEKTTTSRGLLIVQPNEADLYGYVGENKDAQDAFANGRPPYLDWEYGAEIERLVMAAYMSHERGCTIDLTDEKTSQELESFIPLVQQGRGAEIL